MKKLIIALAIIFSITTNVSATFATNRGGEKNNLGTADRGGEKNNLGTADRGGEKNNLGTADRF
jgi:hypothetical protein